MTSTLFSPFKLADVELPNRIVVSPMCQYSADDGCANDWHLGHLGMLANCGAGLVIVEATHVERHGRITHGCTGLYSDDNEAAMARVIAHCRRIGTAKLGIQIAHAGRKASAQRPWEGGGALKPERRSVADHRAVGDRRSAPTGTSPREATHDDIARVREAFVELGEARGAHRLRRHRAALRARLSRALVPVADLQQAHRRVRRLAREPHALRPRDRARGARGGAEAPSRSACASPAATGATTGSPPTTRWPMPRRSRPDGLDYIDVSSGGVTADTRNPTTPGYNVPIAERVKREAGIATRVVGLIVTPEQAEAVVADGKADMVAMARAMLDDPRWGWHAARELGAEVPRVPAIPARRRRSCGPARRAGGMRRRLDRGHSAARAKARDPAIQSHSARAVLLDSGFASCARAPE